MDRNLLLGLPIIHSQGEILLHVWGLSQCILKISGVLCSDPIFKSFGYSDMRACRMRLLRQTLAITVRLVKLPLLLLLYAKLLYAVYAYTGRLNKTLSDEVTRTKDQNLSRTF